MTDKTSSIIKVESERQSDPGSGNRVIETMRAEHSGIITVHAQVPAGGTIIVFTVPANFRAYITRLMWDWPDGNGINFLFEDFTGPNQALIYVMGIITQLDPNDPPRLDWGDGSYPVATLVEGDFVAANLFGVVNAGEITVTYYLEPVV